MTQEEFDLQLEAALGNIHMGDVVAVLEWVQTLPPEFKTCREAQRLRVLALLRDEQWDLAESYAAIITDRNPHAAEFWLMAATAQARQGQDEKAIKTMEKALDLDPGLRELAVLEPLFRDYLG